MKKVKATFVAATGNTGKLSEIKEILKDFPSVDVISMKEAGIEEEIEENGSTFEENALLKARAVHRLIGGYVMADDSGLSVDALEGAPGIYSARFAGTNVSYEEKIYHLWEQMEQSGLESRKARFICVIAVITPDAREYTYRGEFYGVIHNEIIGENGFGYDPVFYVPEYQMTVAQLPFEIKMNISHRGIALRKMAKDLSIILAE